MNLPNKLSLLRIILIPFFVLFFYLNFPFHYVVSVAIFAIAAITDFLDGKIARKRNLVTNLGKFLDPIADKILVATAFIILITAPNAFARFEKFDLSILGTVCICLILARELMISAFRQIAAGRGIIMAAEKLGKYKTACQDFCLVLLMLSLSFVETWNMFGNILNIVGLVFFAMAVILTVVSACSYIIKNKNVLKDNN